MKGILIHTTLDGQEGLKEILNKQVIGKSSKPLGYQVPMFKNKPIVFCSYFCDGYEESYGSRPGVIFETESPVIYACPVDTFELMRGGNWLPGHEKFIFPTIEAMLEKYPTSSHFKKDFQEYFRNLDPKEVYPDNDSDFAEGHHESDYCLCPIWSLGCNEVTFQKPLKIKIIRTFNSMEELKKHLE